MHMLAGHSSTFSSLNLLDPNPCSGIGSQLPTRTLLNPQGTGEFLMARVWFLRVLSVDSKKFQFHKCNQTLFSIRCHQITLSSHNFPCPFLTSYSVHFFLPVSMHEILGYIEWGLYDISTSRKHQTLCLWDMPTNFMAWINAVQHSSVCLFMHI